MNFLGRISIHGLFNSIEEHRSDWPDLNDKEILEAVQEDKKGKKGVATREEEARDRFDTFKKINILVRACNLYYPSQETHRPVYKLLRSLLTDICNTNTTQTTLCD